MKFQGSFNNILFTARSKEQFHLELTAGTVNFEIEDLNGNRKKEQKVPQKAVIGIGAGKIILFMM